MRLHGKDEVDSSNPQVNGGHQRERPLSQKQQAKLLVTDLHRAIHLGSKKLSVLLRPRYVIPRLKSLVQDVSARFFVYANINPKDKHLPRKGSERETNTPVNSRKIDFTKIQPGWECKSTCLVL